MKTVRDVDVIVMSLATAACLAVIALVVAEACR